MTTNVYRKNTFTGLGLNYLSFTPHLYKINSIRTLINRAYNICSDLELFHIDITILQEFFTQNAYPLFLFYRILNSFLNQKFDPNPIVTTVRKEIKYVKLPYMGNLSYDVKRNLQSILRCSFPQLDFRFVFVNSYTIGSLLKSRNALPKSLLSNITYLFKCSYCDVRYLGSTSRWFKHRYLEHRGLSLRTGMPLSKPSFSAVRLHSTEDDHRFTEHNFEIFTFSSDRLDLVISESLLIQRMKPELNSRFPFQLSSF